jgi:hypothetical protein
LTQMDMETRETWQDTTTGKGSDSPNKVVC